MVIAASVSTMAPKSHGEVPVAYEKGLETYREQLGELARGGADVAVAEMLVRISDTLAAVDAAAEVGLPVWVGLSLVPDGDELYLGIEGRHGGETLQDAIEALSGKDVAALFVMHTPVDETAPGLDVVRENWSGTFGAYAHFRSGGERDAQSERAGPAGVPGVREGLERAGGADYRGVLRHEAGPHHGAEGVGVGWLRRLAPRTTPLGSRFRGNDDGTERLAGG